MASGGSAVQNARSTGDLTRISFGCTTIWSDHNEPYSFHCYHRNTILVTNIVSTASAEIILLQNVESLYTNVQFSLLHITESLYATCRWYSIQRWNSLRNHESRNNVQPDFLEWSIPKISTGLYFEICFHTPLSITQCLCLLLIW
jgi:hypothetical protein